MRELNRLGVTSAIDAGGGYQNYPEDYQVIEHLVAQDQLTLRIAYNLFTQKPKEELSDFRRWSGMVRPGQGSDMYRHNGAGEMLVFSAADFEDFREPRPDLAPSMEAELEPVIRLLAENRWPFRLHATYDETISRSLDVFERVHRDAPLTGLNWFFDHAETITPRNIDRIAALGGGIAIQHRMAFQGEYFAERYGVEATGGHAADQGHAGGGPAGRRRHRRHPGRQLQSLGRRSGGWSAAAPSAAWRCTRRPTGSIARRPCACGPKARPGSPARPAARAGSPRASWPTSSVLSDDYMTVDEPRIRQHRVRADGGRRQGGSRHRQLSGHGAATAPGSPGLVAGGLLRRLPACRCRPGQRACHGGGLLVRPSLRRPWPCPWADRCGAGARRGATGFWGALGCSCWAV